MPKGFTGIREAIAEIEARKSRAQEDSDTDFVPNLWFKLPKSAAGKTKDEITSEMKAVIRPLEEGDDVAYAAVHKVKVAGLEYEIDIVCRDQDNSGEPCPGCEMNLKRTLKGWINIIWRNAPDFPKDDETGKYNMKVDYESLPKSDKVAILSSGPVLFGRLDELDEDLEGLTNYDFSVERHGLKLSTKYKVKKHGKKSALSAEDKKLAQEKPDLSWYIRVPDYDEWVERAKGNFGGNSDEEEAPSAPKSPLGRKETIFG